MLNLVDDLFQLILAPVCHQSLYQILKAKNICYKCQFYSLNCQINCLFCDFLPLLERFHCLQYQLKLNSLLISLLMNDCDDFFIRQSFFHTQQEQFSQ